jgi:DNA polymerase delta subunit 4
MSKKNIATKRKEEKFDQDMPELVRFDYNHIFGPSKGITRLQRWERAERFGLNPPTDIKTNILKYNLNKSVLDKFI